MALTRIEAETLLVGRLEALLTNADMSVDVDGSNEDLNDPMGWALRMMGYSVASILAVADGDLDDVPVSEYDEFLDLAELRGLMTILQHMIQTDERLGPHGKWASQLPKRVEDRITRMRKELMKQYGFGLGELSVGTIKVLSVDPEEGTE